MMSLKGYVQAAGCHYSLGICLSMPLQPHWGCDSLFQLAISLLNKLVSAQWDAVDFLKLAKSLGC